ncbi:MAG: hypothetical protein ACJ8C4_05655 [Gemmataceae bacterium]
MDRRTFLASVPAIAAAAVPGSKVEPACSFPEPAFYVLTVSRPVSCAARDEIRKVWDRLWEGKTRKPIVVLEKGMELRPGPFLDMPGRFEAYAKAIREGWMSINDVRRAEGLTPVEGGDRLSFPAPNEPSGFGLEATLS